MEFEDIINAKLSKEVDRPMMKKDSFPVSEMFDTYLRKYDRDVKLPIVYKDLLNYRYANSLRDKHGKITHWENAVYDLKEMEYLNEALVNTYALLKTEGDLSFAKHLAVERIDFCEFGNSVPFRIRIINRINDNYDHFYVKSADASRIYGLELEDMLSPNKIVFLYHKNTLVEEHIPGIPGDVFIEHYLNLPETNKVRIAKEFVKFNERCFARLLGDMRSYNFVIDITPDIEDYQYRIRAIDFDQQSYEGKKNMYLPQFYKENFEYVQLVLQNLSPDVISQYRTEERTTMALRVIGSRKRLMELLNIISKDEISENYKVKILRDELNEHFENNYFSKCKTMGELVKRQLKQMLQKHLNQSQKRQSGATR
ncbi:hypothetical protein LK994_07950 [Ferruginibacter lapsinanis]|uniref:hypothetical protein n=1 Tax=Ferruginibacter lapsinanis TaxID=563172 RepID=UPI001E3324AF|nr:hypothetical protein [Ferruginibacter lapsinanis]UEG48567.1 hypothetical protein LK994_07950 [Ferruginibacter lapsinanis]